MLASGKLDRVSCPFNAAHIIEKRRLQAHIIKCRRNLPPGHDFVQCNFWYNHFVRKHELDDHHEKCEHRLKKEADLKMWAAEPAKFSQPKLIYSGDATQSATEENWEDCSAPRFDPEKLRATASHMPVPEGMTKSKRKEYVEAHRLRLRDLEDKRGLDLKKIKMNERPHILASENVPVDVVHHRKPTTVRPGRIAAKFPGVGEGQSDRLEGSSSMNACNSASESLNSGRTAGRGRGILGWNSIAEQRHPYIYRSGESPNVND